MNRRKCNIIIAALICTCFFMLGAAEPPPEQKEPEDKPEYFAIWNDEQYKNGFVVDSNGKEYSLNDFSEKEKENIYNYPHTPEYVDISQNEGLRADLKQAEDHHWKMTDKDGNLIGEGVFWECWFGSDNRVYPICRNLQTGLYGVRGEQFQVLLPDEFKRIHSVQGPFFSCETSSGEWQVWNADTGKMEWQVPAELGKNISVRFYNGQVASVHTNEGYYLLRFRKTGIESQKHFSHIDIWSGGVLNSQYGFYETYGLSCQEDNVTWYLDTQGNELFCLPGKYSIRQMSDSCLAVFGEWEAYLVNQKGEPILAGQNNYEHIYKRGNKLLAAHKRSNLYGQFWDILSLDGDVLIQKVSNVLQCGENCAYVTKGFSTGLMDYEGNWIWKRSIFQSLMD